jgi:hypothetical protein
MDKHSSEAARFRAFVEKESIAIEDLFSHSDEESDAIYQRVVSRLNNYCARLLDTDEIRDLLAQDSKTDTGYSLAGMFFADAACDLQNLLIENSQSPTNRTIGSIIGVIPSEGETPDETPPALSVEARLALYRALPEDKKAAFKGVIDSTMKLT